MRCSSSGTPGEIDIEPDALDGACQPPRARHGQVEEIVEVGQLEHLFRGRPAEDGAGVGDGAVEGLDDHVAALARRSCRLARTPVAEGDGVGEDPDPIAHGPGVEGAEAGAEQLLVHETAAESFRQTPNTAGSCAVGGLDLGQPLEGVEHHRRVLIAVARPAHGVDELEVGADQTAQELGFEFGPVEHAEEIVEQRRRRGAAVGPLEIVEHPAAEAAQLVDDRLDVAQRVEELGEELLERLTDPEEPRHRLDEGEVLIRDHNLAAGLLEVGEQC